MANAPRIRMMERELEWIRALGSSRDLVLAASNLGALEIVLTILMNNEDGMTVHNAASAVQSPFCSYSGALKRISLLRGAGVLVAGPGRKRSEVRLRVSDRFADELLGVLERRYADRPQLPGGPADDMEPGAPGPEEFKFRRADPTGGAAEGGASRVRAVQSGTDR